MFNTRTLLPCVALVTSAAVSQAAVVAVDFSGDYNSGNGNSSLDGSAQQLNDTGDFNGDTVPDSRTFIPIDHAGLFLSAQLPGAGTTAGGTSAVRAGMQIVNYSTATTPSVGLFRLDNNGANDSMQMTTSAQAGDATAQGAAFAPHVAKNAFLNGLDTESVLGFADQADGFTLSFGNQNTGEGRRARLLVQNGTEWYISETTSGSSSGTLSINAFSETWFPYDPSATFFYEETGSGDTTPLGVGVTGSTFNDIQALGALLTKTSYDGSSANRGNFSVNSLGATLVVPEPSSLGLLGIIGSLLLGRRRSPAKAGDNG